MSNSITGFRGGRRGDAVSEALWPGRGNHRSHPGEEPWPVIKTLHNKSRSCVNSTTRDMWCDLKLVLGKNTCIYQYWLLSELEVKRLDNIDLSDIGNKSIPG